MFDKIQLMDNCTACGACLNSCSQKAISMQEDEYGFVYPYINENKCINCGMCSKVCENISSIIKNKYRNSLAVQAKDWELSKRSASGGMFAILAKYVLFKKGIVFGCSMIKSENNFEIKHIYIEKQEDIYKLQGSKYVQSDIGYCYKQAKEFLEQGKLVLFSGTPCQIAGLKSYLNNDYENLLCIDLSCTGAPSNKMFNDYIYLLESKYNKKIVNFDFRNKEELGWTCGNALITFSDNSKINLYNNLSSYLSFFIKGVSERKSCYSCKYSGLERVSDITICDCWGIDLLYPHLLKTTFNKNEGISLLLINTEKGNIIFENIKDKVLFESVNALNLKNYNHPLRHPTIEHKLREKYLNLYKNYGYLAVDKLFNKNLGLKKYYFIIKRYTPIFIVNFIRNLFLKNNKKVDCLLMTAFGIPNYGSVLAAYALQKTIEKLGYSNKILYSIVAYSYAKEFAKKYLNLTSKVVTLKDYLKLNSQTNAFILGSDNLINLNTSPFDFVSRNLFNYADGNKKLLMISGSIGSWDGSTKNEREHNYIEALFKRFDYISTRENYAKNIIENVFKCDADWINDPVMYLEKDEYLNLINKVKTDYSGCMVQYILYPDENKKEIVEYLYKKYGYKIVKFEGNDNVNLMKKQPSVEDWLSALYNSKFIITDSFHCICFAFIFNKPIVYLNNESNPSRFVSLFKILGVDLQPVLNREDLKEYVLEYDYNKVNSSLKKIRENALSKIKENLEKEKQFTYERREVEKLFQSMNRDYLEKSMLRYKKNKFLFLIVIEPIIIPLIKIIKYIKKNAKNIKNIK